MLREMLNVSRSEFSWTIPNVQCFNAKGEIEREIDVVTVLLPRSGTKAEVRLTECTLNREPHKSVSDAKKLVELKSELQGRFKDVQVETRVYGGIPESTTPI